MAYPKRELEIITECNDEITNDPTCWAMFICEEGCKRHYIWISKYYNDEYIVENSDGYNCTGKSFKTLSGAKRAAEGVAWRQEETGFFTD